MLAFWSRPKKRRPSYSRNGKDVTATVDPSPVTLDPAAVGASRPGTPPPRRNSASAMGQGSSSRRSLQSSFRIRPRSGSTGESGSSLANGNGKFGRSSSKRRPSGSKSSKHPHKGELSEAFNLIHDDFHLERLNINSATEEELMTLPGIHRTTARHIVEYRQAIGGFKKVEDLALVSGVGANKLALIRAEISVGGGRRNRAGGLSRSSSYGTPSEDSVAGLGGEADGHVTGGQASPAPVDINVATIFQLMGVRGISQVMAANIVHHREKRGRFKTVEELAKVKGVNHWALGELRRHLCVDGDDANKVNGAVTSLPNGSAWNPSRQHRRCSSVPPGSSVGSDSRLSEITLTSSAARRVAEEEVTEGPEGLAVYEMLAALCPRPPPPDRFSFKRDKRPALRLATWNLDRFTAEKGDNPGVMEVLSRTVLENGITLMAVQELADKDVLNKLCKELNKPSLKRVQEWVGASANWECQVSEPVNLPGQPTEHLGFVYDSNRGVTMVRSETLTFAQPNNNEPTYPGAFYATFRADNIEFSLLCVHHRPVAKENGVVTPAAAFSPIKLIVETWMDKVQESSLLIVLGDFGVDPSSKDFRVLRSRFVNLVASGTSTAVEFPEEAKPTPHYDNIWMSSSVMKFYTGHWKVVNKGLTHLAIPRGWKWGGAASSHCPIWSEFFVPTLTSLTALCNEVEKEIMAMQNGGYA